MGQTTGSEQAGSTIEARLADPAEPVRLAALAELMKPDAEPARVLEAVAACLNHSSAKVRKLAVVVLGKLAAKGQGVTPAVPALIRALDETQPMPVRVFAAVGLAQAGPAAEPAIEPLCWAMNDPSAKRKPPAHASPAGAPGAASALSPEDVLRMNASLALSGIGAPAVPWLRRLLRASDQAVVIAAISGLGRIGPAARDAAPDLQQLAASPDAKTRQACSAALVKITGNPAAGLPALLQDLRSPDPSLRKASLAHIGELQALGESATPSILPGLTDSDPEVRAASASALAKVQADPAEIVPRLTNLLQDPAPDVRVSSAMALASLGPEASPARASLESMQRETDKRLAAVAKAALKNIGGS
jgi:HEAT repeat protein